MLPLIFGFRHSSKVGNTSQIVDLVAQRFSMKPISISAKTENFGENLNITVPAGVNKQNTYLFAYLTIICTTEYFKVNRTRN